MSHARSKRIDCFERRCQALYPLNECNYAHVLFDRFIQMLLRAHRLFGQPVAKPRGEFGKPGIPVVDLHFKLGLGQFLEDCYTSIETFAA